MNYKLLHQTAATIAFATIASFLLSTLTAEFIGDHELIAVVKKAIVYGLSILIICIPLTVISGKRLAAFYPNNLYVKAKTKRMKWIGINAVIFLIPLAITLNYFAQNNQLDMSFYSLQALEIVCGLINIFLFIKMFADGRQIDSKVLALKN